MHLKIFSPVLVAVISVFCFIGSFTGSVSALSTLPLGGTTFDDAVLIQAGKYTLDYEMPEDTYAFYKVQVNSGQSLRAEITTSTGGYGCFALYDTYKQKQDDVEVINEAFIVQDISIQANVSGYYYFSIGGRYANSQGNTYEIANGVATPDVDLTDTLTPEQLNTLAVNPESVNWGKNWVLILIVTIIVMGVSFLLFRKNGGAEESTESTDSADSAESTESTSPSKTNMVAKKRAYSPFTTCLVITFIAVFGAIVSGVTRNPVWILIFLLPGAIYEAVRTKPGATTKVSSIILLVVIVLEIAMILLNINFNLANFFGESEKYVAGYLLPLGDIKIFGPILITVLSLILLIRTYGPYTRWLSVVLALGGLVAVYIINPAFFQVILKLILERVFDQVGYLI